LKRTTAKTTLLDLDANYWIATQLSSTQLSLARGNYNRRENLSLS